MYSEAMPFTVSGKTYACIVVYNNFRIKCDSYSPNGLFFAERRKGMSLALDALTVIITILIIIYSYRKGLVKSIIELGGCVAAFAASYFLSSPLGLWIGTHFLEKVVRGKVDSYISSAQSTALAGINGIASGAPASFQQVLSVMTGGSFSVPNKSANVQNASSAISHVASSSAAVASGAASSVSSLASGAADTITKAIAVALGRCIAFFIILAICFIIIKIIANLSNAIYRIPVIGTLNAIGGMVIGVAEALVVLFIFSCLVSIAISFCALQKDPPLTNTAINQTYIFKYVHNINPLTQLLFKK